MPLVGLIGAAAPILPERSRLEPTYGAMGLATVAWAAGFRRTGKPAS